MKKFFAHLIVLVALTMGAFTFVACSDNSSGGSKNNYTIQVGSAAIVGSNIGGAKALAVASKSSSSTRAVTRASETITNVDQLYKVSDDMKYIAINYTFDLDVEVDAVDEDGHVIHDEEGNPVTAETIKKKISSSLQIQPNFIFNLGDDYLWLANCWYYVPGFEDMAEGAVKNALNKIRDSFNESHQSVHGGQFIINKNTGAFYTWEASEGAPTDFDDGYHKADENLGWLFQAGDNLYIREKGYRLSNDYQPVKRLTIDSDGSISAQQVMGGEDRVARILATNEGHIGVIKREQVVDDNETRLYPIPYVLIKGQNQPVPLETPVGETPGRTRWSLVSIGGTLYAASSYQRGDANHGANKVAFYHVNISGNRASVGERIAEQVDAGAAFNDDKWFGVGYATEGNTFTFFSQNQFENWKVYIYTFDPATGTINGRPLPEHYNDNMGFYVDGITYEGATSEGFWLCDLSKDEAEWISLDWSNATQWEAQVNKSTMTVEHYEMGNMSLKYTARTNNGNSIVLWVPITGDNRGKVQVITDADGNANIDVKVVVNM